MSTDLKKALLGGTDYLETVKLFRGEDEDPLEVQVRPLSGSEAAEVEKLGTGNLSGPLNSQGGGKFDMKVQIDIGVMQMQTHLADVRAVGFGLTHGDEKWEDEEVDKLKNDWLKTLAEKVFEISGIERKETTFRVKQGDDEPSGDDGDGDAGPVAVGDTGTAVSD